MYFRRQPRLIGQVDVFCSQKNGCGSPALDCRSIFVSFEYIGWLYPPCSFRLKKRLIAHWPLKDARPPVLTDHRQPGNQKEEPRTSGIRLQCPYDGAGFTIAHIYTACFRIKKYFPPTKRTRSRESWG